MAGEVLNCLLETTPWIQRYDIRERESTAGVNGENKETRRHYEWP
jgi:hypothetical protein